MKCDVRTYVRTAHAPANHSACHDHKKLPARLSVINVKKILAVINATYVVAKRKPEKIRLAGTRTLTSAIPVQRSNQLS